MEETKISIIPQPVKVIVDSGYFEIKENSLIQCNAEIEYIAHYFNDILLHSKGFRLKIVRKSDDTKKVILEVNENLELPNEGYELTSNDGGIQIIGKDQVGLFYGIQTLRQLLPPEIESKTIVENLLLKVPYITITDYPRFRWRGHMLDVCRHFFGVDVIKKTLDLMALHKLNVFHWHLTEDQGWRIEIKKYPKLTEIGAWRNETQIKHSRSKKFDGIPHGGFFTQDEIKEIVTYAKERFITVVPEIEIPGHSQAAIASYPELTCFGDNFEVCTKFGVIDVVYCPGKDKVFEFWKDVLNEVMELFPSEIIHTGGDEVPKTRWKQCDDCKKRIKEQNLKDEDELQVFVTNTMASFLASKGRRLMGWNEILDDGLEPNAICHYWAHSEENVVNHIRNGRDTVVSLNGYLYLDSDYKRRPVSKVYSFEPILEGLEPEFHKHILGIESPLWSEWVPDQNNLEWKVFPRLTAVSEIAWTLKENKNYNSFEKRLSKFEKRLDFLNVNYAKKEERDLSFVNKLKSIFGIAK